MTTLKLSGNMRVVDVSKKRVHNDLLQAYQGFYEDEMTGDAAFGDPEDILKWCEAKIRSHTPKERLEVYLTWNGILGWTERIWSISQGEFES